MILEGEKVNLKAMNILELNQLLNSRGEFKLSDIRNFKPSEIQKRAIAIKIEKMKKANEENHNWYTYWLIENRDSQESMGVIGFKGISFLKEVEVGYGLNSQFEGKGFMTEALSLITEWAFSQRNCRKVTATKVLKENLASQKVLEKNGFKLFEEKQDSFNYMKLRRKIVL